LNVSSTLREQLLKAGLVTEKQVKASEQQQHRQQRPPQQSRHKPPPPVPEQKRAAEQAQAAKAARDQQLNRQRQLNAEAKARAAEIRQLIEQHKLPKVESDDRFNFVHGSKLRFVAVDAARRAGIDNGTLFIVRYEGQSNVVPADCAERIRERDPRVVITPGTATPPPVDENDPYKDFVVPDDLKW
jgi:uncharacterized protein YaiL (DUF2058 family)